tara:strand:- start:5646 stop:5822 length:177 start_codon:yes stop_codon:yes gene_type:complete
MLRCDKCNTTNITQQITAMVDANDPMIDSDLSFDYDDFFWCIECEEECKTIEDKKDAN